MGGAVIGVALSFVRAPKRWPSWWGGCLSWRWANAGDWLTHYAAKAYDRAGLETSFDVGGGSSEFRVSRGKRTKASVMYARGCR
jgi:hypothetical protein